MNAPKILILGTDAAGKNHVGQLILRQLRAAGHRCAFREQRLSAPDNGGLEKDKGTLGHVAEWAFVKSYPLLNPLMPFAVDALLRLDLLRLRPHNGAEVIVSHTALRLAAFDQGHKCSHAGDAALRPSTQALLQRLKHALSGDVIVLDIAHQTRQQRVRARGDSSDPFDRYLAARPALSERIEACMVRLACDYLDATLIENDDLSERDLLAAIAAASDNFAAL